MSYKEFPDHDVYDKFGSYLKDVRNYLKRRNRSGFTQGAISKQLGLESPQYISNVERNLNMPSVDIAIKLAEIYQIERRIVYSFFMKYRERQYKRLILERNGTEHD